jgi:uncharacterized protein YutE (UPF0331/DUF86 family)
MPVVDRTLILRKLSNLEEYYVQIEEYKGIALEQYTKDWKIQRIIERTLQMMIETCSDIAGHIISDRKYRVPNSYADTFEVLEENSVIDKAQADSLVRMVKFRNVVVHDYDRVDGGIVIGILKKNLPDFMKFKAAIVAFLNAELAE